MFFNGHKKILQASEVFTVDSDTDADSDLQAAIRASMVEADQHALALRQEDALVLAAAAQGLPTIPTTPARKRSHSAQVSRSQGWSLTCLLVQQCWSPGWSDLPCCRPSTSRGRPRSGGP